MITRRHTLKLLGTATAGAIVPVKLAEASMRQAPPQAASAELLALRDKVEAIVAAFDSAPHFADAEYARLFKHHIARVPACKDCDARLDHGVMFISPDDRHAEIGQRFVFNVKHHTDDAAFVLRPTDDLQKDLPLMLWALMERMKLTRENDAAALFNAPETYDPTVGGDGQPLCSNSHPCDNGLWSNVLATPCDLNGESLAQALRCIRERIHDDAGQVDRTIRGRQLIVPPALEPDAIRAVRQLDRIAWPELQGYFCWHYLKNHHNWFVLTNTEGLVWSEREPISLHVEIDPDQQVVVVAAHSKRGFGYKNPRAVFGSLPNV